MAQPGGMCDGDPVYTLIKLELNEYIYIYLYRPGHVILFAININKCLYCMHGCGPRRSDNRTFTTRT
jgi:hypothetical protein